MIYFLYQYTNRINGKSYIGITDNIERRRSQHKGANGGSRLFHRAIHKYGWDAFKFRILAYLDSIDESARMEHEAIKSFSTLAPSGYNLNSGKPGAKYSGPLSQESREKISAAQKGKIISDETRKKISQSLTGELNGKYGKPMSEDNKRKLIESRKGKKTSPEVIQKMLDTKIRNGTILSREEGLKKKEIEKLNRKPRTWNKWGELSPERRHKMSEAMKGNKINQGKTSSRKGVHTGQVPWNKGKTMTKEYCKRTSQAKKGAVPWNKGKRSGQIPWNKGNKGKRTSLKNQLKFNI